MRMAITRLYDDETHINSVSGCGSLLTRTVECASNLKDFLTKKLEDSDKVYNETKEVLLQHESELMSDLEAIPKMIQERYTQSIKSTTSKVINLQQLIDELVIKNEKYRADIDYFNDLLNNGTKYSTRFDDDSFFASAKMCDFKREQVRKLITEFNEIFLLIVGNPKTSLQNDCFEELRHQIVNIDSIVDYRTGDSKIVSLNNTYAERSRTLQKLIDDYTMVSHQKGRQNLSETFDLLQEMTWNQTTLTEDNTVLKSEAMTKGVQTVKMLIRNGTKIRKAKEVFLRIRRESPDMLKVVLDEAYSCDAKFLIHAISFAQIYSNLLGLKIIRDKMEECGQINSPLIVYIAYVTKDEELDQNVKNVHQGWTDQLKQGNFVQITKFLKQFEPKVVDFPKFFNTALTNDRNNLKQLMKFIDGLYPSEQDIIEDLYDQIKIHNLVDTVEHIELAQWVRDKLHWVDQQNPNSAITGNLKVTLEAIKEKLPEGIRVFVFEPSVILSMKDFAYLMRSDKHDSVRFKVTPHKTKSYYRFEDLRFEKSFYALYHVDANNYGFMRVRMGSGFTDNYYWSVIPTDNGEFFYLKNKANGYHLSSQEDQVCLQKTWIGKCKISEYMNRAYLDNSHDSMKWKFTNVLIRNGILPDRYSG